jgi:glycosyltransferase involved in cell wall biosynthesis
VKHRLLEIIPSLDRSGAEKQLALLAEHLPRDEFEVHVCALTRGGPLEADLNRAGVPYTVIGKRFRADPLAWNRLRRHIAALRPALVQTWIFAANAYGRSAAIAAGVPHIVASERSADPWKSSVQFAVDRALARRTERFVVNSSGVKDFYTSHGLPAEKFVVIPNAVEPSADSPVAREELLAQLGLPPGARLVGAINRLWPQKRLKDLIWAIDLVQVLRDDVHLLIVGEGPLRGRLERYSRQTHTATKVHFLGHRDDVPRIMPHLDVLCLASGYEGLPNVVMEAMAAGRPVIATDIPGNRDLVVPGETGYLVPVGDRAGFARHILELVADPALAARLGAAGRARVLTEFSLDRMIDRYTQLYRQLLSAKG